MATMRKPCRYDKQCQCMTLQVCVLCTCIVSDRTEKPLSLQELQDLKLSGGKKAHPKPPIPIKNGEAALFARASTSAMCFTPELRVH